MSTDRSRVLVIMGSGETAPTMVKPHRAILERVRPGGAVLLDTPYGFQPNADDITTRAVGYFAASVGRDISVASWRGGDIAGAARERALTALRDASWIFAGPGSPTYALRQWRDTPIPGLIADAMTRDGCAVIFASAAALTLGSHTIPVYEIYKAGVAPAWVPGLDIVRAVTGLPAVIIPHYDNAEGGHHDTRFCYLGEDRLALMERALPPEAFVLGVDEHTAVVLDLDERTATVVGNGTMTIRRDGHSIVHPSGDVVAFDAMTSGIAEAPLAGPLVQPATDSIGADTIDEPAAIISLRTESDRIDAAFATAFDAGDIDGCLEAVLELEQALTDWSADTNVSDDNTHARSLLRQMIVRLGDLGRGDAQAAQAMGPVMEILIAMRTRARDAKDFATSDAIRDRLAGIDIEIRDTPSGATWHRREPV